MAKKKQKVKIHFPRLFWVGAVLFAIFFFYKIHLAVRLSFDSSLPFAASNSQSIPTRITIDSVRMNIPIYPTVVEGSTWQISDLGISYLSTSSHPGEKGSTILYSHNTTDRFGPIRWLEKGDEVKITVSDGSSKSYSVSEILTVNPSQVDALISDTETLILYTCSGFLDSQRYIVKATPI